MPALAALVLLASASAPVHIEDVFPGTMVCTCTKTPAPPAAAEEQPYWRSPTMWTIASGATLLVLIGGSIAAHFRATGPNENLPGSGTWNTASTAMLVGGSVLAGFSTAFFVMRF